MNSPDYVSKLDKIVLDKSKFEEVPIKENKPHPILSKQASVKYYLDTYLKPFVPYELFRKLLPTGSQPGNCMGYAKYTKKVFHCDQLFP